MEQSTDNVIRISPLTIIQNRYGGGFLAFNLESWDVPRDINEDGLDFWLFENTVEDARYVIIDDEYVIPDSQLPHFILTNPFDGLTELLADRAIALLNG